MTDNRELPEHLKFKDDLESRIALAASLYDQFYTRCFWHSPPDLEITEDMIPFVAKGLRTHGGHLGYELASRIHPQNRRDELIARAHLRQMTPEEEQAQRISWAYGNTAIDCPRVTRDAVERAARKLEFD